MVGILGGGARISELRPIPDAAAEEGIPHPAGLGELPPLSASKNYVPPAPAWFFNCLFGAEVRCECPQNCREHKNSRGFPASAKTRPAQYRIAMENARTIDHPLEHQVEFSLLKGLAHEAYEHGMNI
jgi:hypothetical protein